MLDLAAAYDILIGRELKERQVKFEKAGAKDLQESAARRAGGEQSLLDARGRVTVGAVTEFDRIQGQTADAQAKRDINALETARDAELKSVELVGSQSYAARTKAAEQAAEISARYLRQIEEIEISRSTGAMSDRYGLWMQFMRPGY